MWGLKDEQKLVKKKDRQVCFCQREILVPQPREERTAVFWKLKDPQKTAERRGRWKQGYESGENIMLHHAQEFGFF